MNTLRNPLLAPTSFLPGSKFSDEQVLDLAEEIFMDDPDMLNAVSAWFRGHISNPEFIERLIFLKGFSDGRATELLEENGNE